MGRKRALKKKTRQRSRLQDELERHYVQGRDDDFLASILRVDDPEAADLAAAYRDVLARSLQRCWNAGDLERAEELFVRHGGRARNADLPVAQLAAAVVDLDHGRLAEAHSRIESLAARKCLPNGLLLRLAALCTPDPDARDFDPLTELEDYLKLRRSLHRYGRGELKRIPRNLALLEREARDVLQLARSLEAFESPTPTSKQALTRLRREARGQLDRRPPAATEQLLVQAIRLAGTIQRLSDIATVHDRSGDLDGALRSLRGARKHLGTLAGDAPPLLAGLRHQLILRSRDLVERLAEHGGSTALVAAYAALGDAGGPVLEIDGDRDGRTQLEKWDQARAYLEEEDHGRLARLIADESAKVDDPNRLAMLWGLELWALLQEYEVEDSISLDPDEEPPDRRVLRRAVRRLRAMAGELRQRLPSDDVRRQIAGILRREALDLFGVYSSAEHLELAETLLEYFPYDPELLLLGLTVATSEDRSDAVRSFETRIAARGPATKSETADLERLVVPPPDKDHQVVAGFYRRAMPLLGDHWPAIRAAAMDFLGINFVSILVVAARLELSGEASDVEELRQLMRHELDHLRALFRDEPSFEILEILVESPFDHSSTLHASYSAALRRRPDLESALAAFRLVDALSDGSGFETFFAPARSVAVEAVLDRLDHRWRLWSPAFRAILPTLEPPHLVPIDERLEAVLADPSGALDEEGRKQIEGFRSFLDAVLGLVRRYERKTTRSRRRTPRRPGPKRKGPRGQLGGQLDLF